MITAEKLFHSLFSPPRAIREPKHEDHNKNSLDAGISPRCQFTFSDGRQCRNQQAQLCVHHSSRKERERLGNGFPDEGLAALVALCADLTTSTNINRALSQVFLLMAQGRIPQKQAVAFGYITQLLLQTVPGIRSEYISVHGYDAWENNLKSKINPLAPTSAAQNEPPAQTPPPAPPTHDYGDLLRRSRDMMAGKYEATPEGRREANTLALELELISPAPAKPRKDFVGRTVALVRRLRDSRRERHAIRESPLSRGFQKGQELRGVKEVPQPAAAIVASQTPPTTAPVPSPSLSNVRNDNFVAPSRPPEKSNERDAILRPGEARCSSGRGAAQPALRPLSSAVQSAASNFSTPSEANSLDDHFVASARPESRTASNPRAKDHPQRQAGVPGFTLTRTGHSTDWYAPASWSGRRQPNPYPSRRDKLKCQLRAISNRRRQHQMQNRAFWR